MAIDCLCRRRLLPRAAAFLEQQAEGLQGEAQRQAEAHAAEVQALQDLVSWLGEACMHARGTRCTVYCILYTCAKPASSVSLHVSRVP